jgi:hypothetical protein
LRHLHELMETVRNLENEVKKMRKG